MDKITDFSNNPQWVIKVRFYYKCFLQKSVFFFNFVHVAVSTARVLSSSINNMLERVLEHSPKLLLEVSPREVGKFSVVCNAFLFFFLDTILTPFLWNLW